MAQRRQVEWTDVLVGKLIRMIEGKMIAEKLTKTSKAIHSEADRTCSVHYDPVPSCDLDAAMPAADTCRVEVRINLPGEVELLIRRKARVSPKLYPPICERRSLTNTHSIMPLKS